MTVYQFYDPQPVLLNLAGIGPIPNGKIYFYEIGTTTPADTWSNYAKGDAYLNANPVLLDSSGRPSTEIWLDGEYTVAVFDGDDVPINTFDMRPAADDAASIPIPEDDEYLGGDGAAYIAKKYRGLPDPTGLIGYFPVSDGEGYVMTPTPEPPVIPEPEIVITTTPNKSFQAGVSDSTTKYFVQVGTGSAPASGSQNTSASVVFPTAFAELWHVSVTQKHNGVTANSSVPSQSNTTESTTGFTTRFSTNENSASSEWNIINSVPFSWMAVGTRTVTP